MRSTATCACCARIKRGSACSQRRSRSESHRAGVGPRAHKESTACGQRPLQKTRQLMKTMRRMLVVAGVMAALSTLGNAQQDVERVTLKFADASRPGKLKVHLMNGAITVKGSNRNDVLVESRQR